MRRSIVMGIPCVLASFFGLSLTERLASWIDTPLAVMIVDSLGGWGNRVAGSSSVFWQRFGTAQEFTPTHSVSFYEQPVFFHPWLRMEFPDSAAVLLVDSLRSWPEKASSREVASGTWVWIWIAIWVAAAALMADPRGRRAVTGAAPPAWDFVVRTWLAAMAFWCLAVPGLVLVQLLVRDAMNAAVAVAMARPWAATPWPLIDLRVVGVAGMSTTVMCAWVVLIVLARIVVSPRAPAHDPMTDSPRPDCRTCGYVTGSLPRCPECGDSDPHGPGPHRITATGAWIHRRAWRRWTLRGLVAAVIVGGLLAPVIAAYVQLVGVRVGWW